MAKNYDSLETLDREKLLKLVRLLDGRIAEAQHILWNVVSKPVCDFRKANKQQLEKALRILIGTEEAPDAD